ncbi:tetraspanin, partial [Plakobranchus ocellatus]
DDKMGLSRFGKFLKYSVFLFNVIILVAGCCLLGFGVYSRTTDNQLTQISVILGDFYNYIFSMALMASGVIVIVISFFGCCGAIKEVKCMLGTFFLLLLIMLVGMMVGGIIAYVKKDDISGRVLHELSASLNESYGMSGQQEVTDTWNLMQRFLECCGVYGGVNSTTSWAYYREYSLWYRNQTKGLEQYVPDSCCRNVFGNNRTKCVGGEGYEGIIPAAWPPVGSALENDLLFTEGCYTAIMDILAQNTKILAGVAAGIAVLMVLGMVFAVCLCRRIKDDIFF